MKFLFFFIFLLIAQCSGLKTAAQNCPVSGTTFLTTNPSTYYPATDSVINPGAKIIHLGAAGYGNTPISTGELLLLIQMQGAQINSSNTTSYGDGIAGGASGYLTNASLKAGTMEYVVATNTVPLTGGTLNLLSGTVNGYKNQAFGADGQYRFQLVRVGLYYNLTLGATITAPAWNGTAGGVVVLSITNTLNFNGQTISAAGLGFRGGAARQLPGGNGGMNTDIVSTANKNYHASKGEGIAGTPRFVNNQGLIVDNGSANEGYPNGSFAMGAPGNAGGGGTDGNPSANDQNSGGGGGANGGAGGRGGNSWNSNLPVGGAPGSVFAQQTASRLVMGGGGGAGTTNNGTGNLSAGFSTSGAIGGGIVLVTANAIIGTGTIDVSGENAFITVLNDGSGGGGAGGSILLYAGNGTSNITALAKGGTGGANTGTGSPHGPGGGGGGGVIYSSGPLSAASSVAGGAAGTTAFGTTNYNASSGVSGLLATNVTRSQVPNQFLYCSLLPVNFIAVHAAAVNDKAIIDWQVTTASANQRFLVEKSEDGVNFVTIGTVSNAFSFTAPAEAAVMYYRVRALDIAGQTMISPVVQLKQQSRPMVKLSIAPNPATGDIAVLHFVSDRPSASARINIISSNGILLRQQEVRLQMGINNIQCEHLMTLPNGYYIVQVCNDQSVSQVKFLLQH
ncbi:MAG TPA: T9SS type A sorting domain-containing protein [Chitinophagaceae bacterium]|nr:T9SS type A sorting domain-containing protein [Chitinophagaceae bacterium]